MKWKLHFPFFYTLALAERITCCDNSLLSVLCRVVIIKYRILWLSRQFIMLVPSLHLFFYIFFATEVFHINWVVTSRAYIIDFLYSLCRWYSLSIIIPSPCWGFPVGKAYFFIPLTLSLATWHILFNKIWGQVQCAGAAWTWRSIMCSAYYPVLLSSIMRKNKTLSSCVPLVRLPEWETLAEDLNWTS